MIRFSSTAIIRSCTAVILTVCLVLSSGCVSVVISEKPTEEATVEQSIPTQPPVMADADLTFPDEIQGSYVPGVTEVVTDSNGEVITADKELEIDWDTRVVTEKDPNELLLIEQWESKAHQQTHISQPLMVQLRGFKDAYITKTTLGEIKLL